MYFIIVFYAVYHSQSVFCRGSSISSDICLNLTQMCGNSTDYNSAALHNHDLLLIRSRRCAKNQDNNKKKCMKMSCIYMHIFGLLVFTKPFSEIPDLGNIMLKIGRKKSSTHIKKHSELNVSHIIILAICHHGMYRLQYTKSDRWNQVTNGIVF